MKLHIIEQQIKSEKNWINSNLFIRRIYNIAYSLSKQLVGAQIAIINACGKKGQIDTALKLFFISIPSFDIKPNIVTYSALLDSLLKNRKLSKLLKVLKYMKKH